jgi:hypothetical protein
MIWLFMARIAPLALGLGSMAMQKAFETLRECLSSMKMALSQISVDTEHPAA